MVDFKFKKSGLFAAGVLFGTAGIKILTSKDAKKLYTGCTAAVLRAKDCIMKTATSLQENAEDIYAEAKHINEERAAEAEEWERIFWQQQRKDLYINFENFVEIYFTDMENRLRESTIKNKRYVFDLKVTPYFKKKKMCEIKTADIRACWNCFCIETSNERLYFS